MSVRAGNITLGPDGFVPSALLFDEFPTVGTILGPWVPRQALTECAKAEQRARKLMAQELAAANIKRSITHKTSPETDHI